MTKPNAIQLMVAVCAVLAFLCPMRAQQTGSLSSAATALPRVVRFNGTAKDLNGNPLTGAPLAFAAVSDALNRPVVPIPHRVAAFPHRTRSSPHS
jgi:hypothetical protein